MAAPLILDTGPFVAIVHRGDRRHPECAEVLRNWEGAILTTEAVLTETLHLFGQAWSIQEACLEFFLRGAFQFVPASLESLRRVTALMGQYADGAMEFADAHPVGRAAGLPPDQ